MKNSTPEKNIRQKNAKSKLEDPLTDETDEMEEMEIFIRKKRLQNQILKKATENKK